MEVDILQAIVEARHDLDDLKTRGGVRAVAGGVKTDIERGLSSAQVVANTAKYGVNRLPPVPVQSLLSIIWQTLHDKTLIMLIVAAIINIILGVSIPCPAPPEECAHPPETGWIEGTAILASVAIVTLVTSINDYNKEAKFRKLNAVKEDHDVSVMRDGKLSHISMLDLTVGDIVKIGTGDRIVADGIFIEGAALSINESSATGESEPVKKGPGHQLVFLSGTEVMEGTGTMLVVAVGVHSYFGRLMMALRAKASGGAAKETKPAAIAEPSVAGPSSVMLTDIVNPVLPAGTSTSTQSIRGAATHHSFRGLPGREIDVEADDSSSDSSSDDEGEQDDDSTPLQRKLEAMAENIAKFGLTLAVVLFVVLILKQVITNLVLRKAFTIQFLSQLVRFLITSISIIVVAIPEGLPLAVTLALAFSMIRMIKDKNLVRELSACEVMGGATTICSDKTGTLTQNKMTVVAGTIAGHMFNSIEESNAVSVKVGATTLALMSQSIGVNSTASEVITDESPNPVLMGNSTEIAMIEFCKRLKLTPLAARTQFTPAVGVFPFSSKRKKMGTLIELEDGKLRQHVKGAPEIVLAMCSDYIDAEGVPRKITSKVSGDLKAAIARFASAALRTIAIAYVELPAGAKPQEGKEPKEIEEGLTLIGIVGIQDPVRPEVPHAVQQCQGAGIVVRMVTGDNIDTAKAIAKQCGIYNERVGLAMEGPVFRTLSHKQLIRTVPRLQVLARSSPLDKQLLVGTLQKMGEVVAVTGDGTNDGPALSMADVGFAMGIAGTEVAKEASSIILMDDNFASIVKAVMWGRNVFDSVLKFIQFQLTVNVVAVIVTIVAALSSEDGESALTPVQLLWVNLVMDTLAALALATEFPTEELLKRKPYGRNLTLINRKMWKHVISQAIFQLAVCMTILYAGPTFGLVAESKTHYTIIFNTFVCMQYFNFINARRIYDELNIFQNIHKNAYFVVIMLVIAVLQLIIVTFGEDFTSTVPLTVAQWFACLGLGVISLPISFAMRLVPDPTCFVKPEPIIAPKEPALKLHAEKVMAQLRVVRAFKAGRIEQNQRGVQASLNTPRLYSSRSQTERAGLGSRRASTASRNEVEGSSSRSRSQSREASRRGSQRSKALEVDDAALEINTVAAAAQAMKAGGERRRSSKRASTAANTAANTTSGPVLEDAVAAAKLPSPSRRHKRGAAKEAGDGGAKPSKARREASSGSYSYSFSETEESKVAPTPQV